MLRDGDHHNDGWAVLVGDAIARLRGMPDGCAQCCVTSPPYWGLRDYGVDGQIGLEETPEVYVERLVAVFREVRRVLRPDGTLWLNLGDTYTAEGAGNQGETGDRAGRRHTQRTLRTGTSASRGATAADFDGPHRVKRVTAPMLDGCGETQANALRSDEAGRRAALPRKSLVGVPWRVALALQADGWTLRSEIIWHKPSPMPESVTDRPTRSHEQVFLLAPGPRYFYDAEAIAEASKTFGSVPTRAEMPGGDNQDRELAALGVRRGSKPCADRTRNARTVWTIASTPFPEAHFATYPIELPLRCIRAGTSERGRCTACGAPWRRVTEREAVRRERPNEHVKRSGEHGTGNSCANTVAGVRTRTLGWEPGCGCGAGEAEPCLVLDPFSGAGTTGVAARLLGRAYAGIELNAEYAAMSARRIERETRPGTARTDSDGDAPLFAAATEGSGR